MGSLKYEISQRCKELQQIEASGGGKQTTTQSWRAYMNHAVHFGEWCKRTYKCRHFEDCRAHIQDYADWLGQKNLSAHTIHTYMAGVCRIYKISLADIQKPIRVSAENTRSRGPKDVDKRADTTRDASPRYYDFASVVGCRREDYARLRGSDLVYDESGYLCVRVRKGKGGKYQEQRVLPGDEVFVRSFFNSTENYVFSRKEVENKIDLHHLRDVLAQRAYQYYIDRLRNEPEYRTQLEQEIKARWRKYNKRHWKQHEFEGTYKLRGANKELAQRLGRPIEYDRLAILAVSVYHLSHWRTGVTVSNYLLAY